jgi:hypothetical protein
MTSLADMQRVWLFTQSRTIGSFKPIIMFSVVRPSDLVTDTPGEAAKNALHRVCRAKNCQWSSLRNLVFLQSSVWYDANLIQLEWF